MWVIMQKAVVPSIRSSSSSSSSLPLLAPLSLSLCKPPTNPVYLWPGSYISQQKAEVVIIRSLGHGCFTVK